MSARLSPGLPDGDRNGLERFAGHLVAEPDHVQVAIVLMDTIRLTTDVGTGNVVPTVRIRAIEPIAPDSADAKQLHRLLRSAYEHRTGKVELPFEMKAVLDEMPGGRR
jgi:hypothetical protein